MTDGRRIRVALLSGGISPEHEVSLSSGQNAALALPTDRYDLLPVCIRRDGEWLIPEAPLGKSRTPEEILPYFDYYHSGGDEVIDGIGRFPVERVLERLRELEPDVCLILLHGRGGEDGLIQGFLEFGGFRYTGPGVMASALGMDKIRCLNIMSSRNFLAPPYVYRLELPPNPDFNPFIRVAEKKFGYPCFVKPARVGSSVGMSIANNRVELEEALHTARIYDSQIVIEEFIRGTEVTCGVIDRILPGGESERILLPPTEIVVKKAGFFDYESKYTPGMTEEITPARLPDELLDEIRQTAGEIHQLIGCEGMSRIDMIIRGEDIFVLECNTIPGMTPTSLLPQGADAAGISFPDLLDIIIQYAFREPGRKKDREEKP